MSSGSVMLVVLRSGLAVALVAAGAAKAVALREFAATLGQLMGVRTSSVRRLVVLRNLAAAIAAAELVVGVASLSGFAPRATDIAVLALTGAFAAVAAYAVISRTQVECRCFGALTSSTFTVASLSRAGVLCAAALSVVLLHPSEVFAWSSAPVPAGAVVVFAVSFAVACATASRAIDGAGALRRSR